MYIKFGESIVIFSLGCYWCLWIGHVARMSL